MSFRRSNISRQFTDSELAVDERTTGHLTAPAPALVTGTDHSQSYRWLKEDLALRSALTQQIAGEQQLAFAQSERHEQARQFEQAATDEVEAIDAYNRANELRAQGMPWKDSVGEVISGNAQLGLNESFLDMVDRTEGFNQTDLERQNKQLSLQAGINNQQLSVMSSGDRLRFLESPEGAAHRDTMLKATAAKEARGLPLSELEDEARLIDGKMKLSEAKLRYQNFQQMDPDFNSEAVLAGVMDEAGLPVANMEGAAALLRSTPLIGEMLLHPEFLYRQPEEVKTGLAEALDVMSSESATADEKRAAKGRVQRIAGRFKVQTQRATTLLKQQDELKEFGAATGKSHAELVKEITDISGRLDKQKKPLDENGPDALNAAESWIKQQVMAFPAANALFEGEYKEKLNQARALEDPAEAVKMAQWISGDFGKDLMTALGGNYTPTTPPTTDNTGPKVGEVIDGYEFTGGNPADKTNWKKQ